MQLVNQLCDYLKKLFSPIKQLWGKINDNTKTFIIIFSLCAIYIGVGYSYIDYEYYYYGIIPLLLVGLLLYYFHLDKVLYLICFLTPLSIRILLGETFAMSIPVEPMLILFFLCFIIKSFLKDAYPKKILTHPVTIAISFYLIWMFITCFSSTHPLVSFKYFASKLLYIVSFYFATIPLFAKVGNIKTMYWSYSATLLLVVFYATISFASKGFEFNDSFYSMQPFYNDHTAYGAILAMFLILVSYFLFFEKTTIIKKIIYFIFFCVFLMGLALSYSRAAWLSVLPAFGVFLILKLKIKFKYIIYAFSLFVIVFFAFRGTIMEKISGNEQDSSGNISEHISSISNISTDASNVERLNRWACVFRMFDEKPILGWGPGTYQFEYAAFQKSYQLSTISTNAGNLGNAHSEYFGPLAESGIFGMLSFIIIVLVVIYVGIQTYNKTQDKQEANLALFLTMALITYYIHGGLNNFLDTDKLSIPFWFFTSAIVSLNIYSKKKSATDL
ncbi:MAG: O-antigen ligase family protein [Bacteroidales bacterium]|jgi:O-antigen ligase|nr:O-antigen ligase family protein [Bacteroidales bacterium]